MSHLVAPHRTLPQELVDQIIDEFGAAYRDPDHGKRSDHRTSACEALHACALVSKDWTGRSRMHLFREVKIRGDKDGLCLIPPQPLMPHIEKLKMQLECENYRLFPSPDLLTPFYTAPITCLGITGGVFATEARGYLMECIAALSATLQTVVFKSCSLSLYMITDIMLVHPGLKHLHLHACGLKPATADPFALPHPSERSETPDLELGVFSQPLWGGHDLTVAVVAQLRSRFARLDLDHVCGLGATRATNALIKASAASLSSLTVHILPSTFLPLEGQPPFSLGDCFNLSELTVDMEHAGSCIVATSVNILSTLNPIQHSRLEGIRLVTSCFYQWFCKKSRTERAQAWRTLDTILSELAKVAMSIGGKRLTFVLVSVGIHKEKCMSFGRKWLPELLPRFHELGSLRADYRRSRFKVAADRGCSCSHGPICMGEDHNDPSRS